MRKRKNSEEDVEMEVDDEERKVEIGGYCGANCDDDKEEMESADGAEHGDCKEEDSSRSISKLKKLTSANENPFLDSFYSLSAADPKERAQAAQVMLFHCLLGPNSNSKDAAYAFRRLLNGLCSGRAAARQGNASALASFLKISFQLDNMNEIRNEAESDRDEESSSSLLIYVRNRLLSVTDPQRTQGKKKGSEERDYYFGRLFGILGLVRSSILLLPGDEDEIREVASALMSDLIELFWYRRWMREPAAHGITAMLNLFMGSNRRSIQNIGWHLVKEVVVPKILVVTLDGSDKESDFQTILKKYCAEQVGIGAYIQSRSHSNDLPFPLDQPIISSRTLPWIGQALSETSTILQPRTHFVWDTIWCYLMEEVEKTKLEQNAKSVESSSTYCIRKTIPLGEDRVTDVIDAIMKVVVEEKLLRKEEGSSFTKTTHERKALALCVVRNLAGAPFVSSISGPTQITMRCDAIEHIILTKNIIQHLFLDVITAGKSKIDTSHLLKPLALQVLSSLVESTVQSGDTKRHLACVKAISNCDPLFDNVTKTKTISKLMLPSSDLVTPAKRIDFWGQYFAYLEKRFLELCFKEDGSIDADRYIELIYTSTKRILHHNCEHQGILGLEITEYRKKIAKRVLCFLMSTAFFDCSTLKKPMKNIPQENETREYSYFKSITEIALNVRVSLQGRKKIAYPFRVMISSRFFALLSEFVISISRDSTIEENVKVEKDSIVFVLLEEIMENWIELESNDAQRYTTDDDDDSNDDDMSPERAIKDLRDQVNDLRENMDSHKGSVLHQSERRCISGISILSIVLYLHRLSCGSDDEMGDSADADEKEDEENICNAIIELKDVANRFQSTNKTDSNPLLRLSEVCTNILSSPVGSGDIRRGAAPRLVREAVRYAWLGSLKLAVTTATKEKTLLDNAVMSLLMDAIGASTSNESVSDDESGMNEDDEESVEELNDDYLTFSKASEVLNNSDNMEDQDLSEKESEDSDIELDPSKLRTMLEDEDLEDVADIPLEHFEGADAALAQLIKLRKDARKAGQERREKIELSNQLRCTLLIEILLDRSHYKLFQSDVIVRMVVPLLVCRKRLAVSSKRILEGDGKCGTGDKEALINRLTNLIKRKLCKIRPSSMSISSDIDMDAAKNSFQFVMKDAKTCKDMQHLSCCSSSLIFLLRMMSRSPEVISYASEQYGNLVRDWSTKRTCGASLLEDFISQMPALARASVSSALSCATQDAKGFYLKLEAYNLLSLLFKSKPNSEVLSEMEIIAHAKFHKSQDNILVGINITLNDEEIINSKLAKAVFAAFETVLPYVSSPASSNALDLMTNIKIAIKGLGERYTCLNSITLKLVKQIESSLEVLNATSATSRDDKSNAKKTAAVDDKNMTNLSRSGKKSKKKKKR